MSQTALLAAAVWWACDATILRPVARRVFGDGELRTPSLAHAPCSTHPHRLLAIGRVDGRVPTVACCPWNLDPARRVPRHLLGMGVRTTGATSRTRTRAAPHTRPHTHTHGPAPCRPPIASCRRRGSWSSSCSSLPAACCRTACASRRPWVRYYWRTTPPASSAWSPPGSPLGPSGTACSPGSLAGAPPSSSAAASTTSSGCDGCRRA
eukprot:scaffold86422_cov63-Phaeocystis_antarctica.AAC.2